ncbi:hypothetical protein QUF58_09135 [Anaerolineales bacterium HSG24]|nr:hypothetical protein [Anaerolineales bacterium HSG24]
MGLKKSLLGRIGLPLICLIMLVCMIIMMPRSTLAQTPPPTSTLVAEMPAEQFIKDQDYRVWDDVTDEEGGVVNIFDLTFVASRYNSTNRAADVNNDGKVDIFDLAVLASNFNIPESDAEIAGVIVTPEPLPLVESGSAEADFGAVIHVLEGEANPPEGESSDADAQGSYVWKPLKVGVGIDRLKTWDYMDGQTNTPPDFYAVVSVGGSSVRTNPMFNQFESFPYWRLGWWQYNAFPRFDQYDPAGDNYFVPINLEIRDDDGRICYGYFGCRQGYEVADATLQRQSRVKRVRFYPASCRVVDEAGNWNQGSFLDGQTNRCRVYLYSWGDEWPRVAVNYYIDGSWE